MGNKTDELKSFIDTGRFMNRRSFTEKNPDVKLLDDCTDVVHYVGGDFIQVLKSGIFYVDENFQSRSLDESEVILFNKKNNK